MLSIENLHKVFQASGNTEVRAVDGISLSVEPGRLLTLLGPSGCGKTTTLRCLAGLERPDSGRIVIGDTTVFDSAKGIFVPPSDRGIGMVFQSYAIWPHMSVFENVAFPLRVARTRKYSSAQIKDKVGQALEMVRLGGFEHRSSTQLSGGQQQRLALGPGRRRWRLRAASRPDPPRGSRAARSSPWRWRAASCTSRRCCCSTSLFPI